MSSTFIRFRAKAPRSSRNCGREGNRAETVRRSLRSAPFACLSPARWPAATPMTAVNALRTRPQLAPAALIEFAHGALRSTRGAALAVADLDLSREVRYAGIGNISGVLNAPGAVRHMVSHSGIVGHEACKIQEFVYPWSQDALLIMHSDGLATHWNLDQYPGLAGRHPSLIAGVLYRDFTRGHDDVTVIVAKK